jgi:hypothetical protein
MPLARLAATPPLPTPLAPAALTRAIDALVSAPHRMLARTAGPSLAPALSERVPSPPALLALVRALTGRLVVANPCAVVRLPWAVGALARAALAQALQPASGAGVPDGAPDGAPGDERLVADRRRLEALQTRLPGAAAALAPGAAWGAAVLYEPTTLTVRLAAPGTEPPAPEPVPAQAWLAYRLALVIGRDAPAGGVLPEDAWARGDAAVAGAPATAWPPGPRAGTPWFVRRLLVPDAQVAAQMDDATLARWAMLTGRGGGVGRDRYWFAESWERFCEPGRQVGHVLPDQVGRSWRPTRVPPAATAWGSAVPASPLTPEAERGICVPPGYCLLDCIGTLEVSVVVV